MSSKNPRDVAGLLQWLYDQGEKTATQVLEELLSNRAVSDGIGSAIQRAARTKGKMDRNMQTLLSLLNVPSRADYAKLATKIEALQGSLVNLNIKLDRVLAATASPPKPSRKRAKAPAKSGTRE